MSARFIALVAAIFLTGPFAIVQNAFSASAPDDTIHQTEQWTPSESDKAAVERLSHQYFTARDGGQYQDAYALQTDGMKKLASFDNWSRLAKGFSDISGKVISRQIKKVTWYKDPPGAPALGVYAAVDFTSRFENIDVHCGYLMWHQQENGTFRMAREEASYIDKKTQERLDGEKLAEIKTRFRCQ